MNIPDQIDEIAETRDWQPTRYSGDLGGKSIHSEAKRYCSIQKAIGIWTIVICGFIAGTLALTALLVWLAQ